MADMYKSDDFSLFLHQILLTGSTSAHSGSESSHRGLEPIPGGEYVPTNMLYSPLGNADNDVDEHECESEDGGFEILAEEAPAKTAPSRNSSKRSRAAEVHNLSEKRRRSRINEKMKALQNLIPNSNKTDKASMLDEAIEYLKQLQLQVQMLTMRNGLSLYPMCLPGASDPGQPSTMNMGFLEENRPLNIDLIGLPHVLQETSTNAPNQNHDPVHLPRPVIHSGTSLGLGSSVQGPIIPTQLQMSSMVADIFRDDVLPHQQPDAGHCQTNLLGLEVVGKALMEPISCEAQSSRRENNAFEPRVLGSQRPDRKF